MCEKCLCDNCYWNSNCPDYGKCSTEYGEMCDDFTPLGMIEDAACEYMRDLRMRAGYDYAEM